jgi:hypothetical protein
MYGTWGRGRAIVSTTSNEQKADKPILEMTQTEEQLEAPVVLQQSVAPETKE